MNLGLNTPEGAAQFGALLDEVQAAMPAVHVAVVIDTISRAVVGEENSNDTIQGFYRHTGLELKRREVTWLRLDHAGHEGSHARGASAKGDDVDVVWRLGATDDGIELKSDKRRMGWVPERVAFRVVNEPVLRYEKAGGSWLAGTHEVARLLDELGVAASAGMRAAKAALTDAGQGRRGRVVESAQRYRRTVEKARFEGRETPPETLSPVRAGDTSGDTGQKAGNHGQETPPETPGDSPAARLGDTASPLVGDADPGASPAGPDEEFCAACGKKLLDSAPGKQICSCDDGHEW